MRTAGLKLDREDAASWLAQQVAILPKGQVTVLFHSIFWQYLPTQTQSRLRSIIADAGARATIDAPFAWLAMELQNTRTLPDLTLTQWPGGETRSLATVHFHGDFVRWRG